MTEDPNETRRLRSAFAATAPHDAPTTSCPSAATIWDGVVEELGPRELRRLIGHIASCPACTESWRLASEIAGDDAAATGDDAPEGDGDRRLGRVGWASAAAAVLGFVLVGLAWDGAVTPGSLARSTGTGAAALALTAPEGATRETGCTVQWTELEGATYDVQVLTDRLELVTERSALTQPRLRIPDELLTSLPVGSQLRVHIAAKRGLAGVVAEATFDLHCAR